ncbi:MAG: ATP-binding cassette domain-containing protein [Planctomycetota bacterium]|nr:MAG: ATP-binding cassette domain-containing protein [Planctomycetota bacterium]
MSDLAPALVLAGVTKRFGDFTAVDDLSLEVPKGSISGFLGPNGAGKTTTIRMVLDIIRPTSGRISILGRPSALEVRDRIGYLPEEKGLYKKMKAAATIAYFASLKGLDRRRARRRAYELLERYGLKDFAEARTEALSKGMQQKVQVLASIAHEPEFVVLDEPFSGLDPVNQEVMEQVIRDMSAAGSTIIFSTHVMAHAERICDRIVLIAKGRKMFDGTIPEAKALMPRRVLVEGGDGLAALAELPAVAAARPPAAGDGAWEFQLREGADPQDLLQACFERGVRLRRFDRREPDLHEVFVHLVGPEAKEAAFR